MEALLVLLVLVILGGSLLGFVSAIQLFRALDRIAQLESRLERLIRASDTPEHSREESAPPEPADDTATSALLLESARETEPASMPETVNQTPVTDTPSTGAQADWEAPGAIPRRDTRQVREDSIGHLLHWMRENWMVWLGGVCLALAGIFLVRYSIEQGLLGPVGRVVAGLASGLALHVAAEYLRRKTGEANRVFGALAGAGSITLYASLFAAVRMYELIEPGPAFLMMAVVALLTMAMAYLHGPVLAAFGILGAYLVPVLVSSGGGQVIIALIYTLVVAASGFLLLRYVYRRWLWWGTFLGAVIWWLITTGEGSVDDFRPMYVLVLGYLALAIPSFDWLLVRPETVAEETFDPRRLRAQLDDTGRTSLSMMIILIGMSACGPLISADHGSPWGSPWLLGLPLYVLVIWVARSREPFCWAPWLMLITHLGAWILTTVEEAGEMLTIESLPAGEAVSFLIYLSLWALAGSALALWRLPERRFGMLWASLAAVAPVLLIVVGYLLTTYPDADWRWAGGTLLFSLVYMIVATGFVRRGTASSLIVWLFVGGHLGLSVAAAMLFGNAVLTLAIAAQIMSIAWIIRTFELPELGWLLKIVVALVLIRLTLNPWLLSYDTGFHWPLWTFGGATACAVVGRYLIAHLDPLRRWTEGAALHLLVLTIWAEIRYVIHDGNVFDDAYTFIESTVYVVIFAALALVYHYRSLVSGMMEPFYRAFALALTVLSLANYGLILVNTLKSRPWIYHEVGDTPVFNILLASFGLPVVAGLAYARFYLRRFRRYALGFAGLAGLAFVSIEVRHLWEQTVRLDYPPTSSGELYTYSAVWLLLAVAAIVVGSMRAGRDVYFAGLALLAVVIAKLFLVDMAGLEGLLRVASFMGLGLCLLGLSYLHQRLGAGSTGDDAGSVSR